MSDAVKHTPGPWSMSEPPYDSVPWLYVYGPADPLSGVASHIMHKDRSEAEKIANARLIAAAPELLEACLAYAKAYDEVTGTIHVNEQVRAAISKATGDA